MSKKARLIFIGGYLGAGKTTLVWEAARLLMSRGRRVGIITNDQAPDLVDTALLRAKGLQVEEVAGSCFCCNFSGLVKATKDLEQAVHADVLLAEPVGSCTDLASTLLQPLQSMFSSDFIHSPLTVLADPGRLMALLENQPSELSEYIEYIYQMQLEEADLVVVNKVDRIDAEYIDKLTALVERKLSRRNLRFMSARMGISVEEWLDEVLESKENTPRRINVDYDLYTKGELSLAWFNGSYRLELIEPKVLWPDLCVSVLESVQKDLQALNATIGHVKLLLSTAYGHISGSVTDFAAVPSVLGEHTGSSVKAELVFNARAATNPEILREIIAKAIDEGCGSSITSETLQIHSKRPGKPEPEYRM